MALGSARLGEPQFGSRTQRGAPNVGLLARLREELHTFLDLAADGCRVVTRQLDETPPAPRLVIEIGCETTRLVAPDRHDSDRAWIPTADADGITTAALDAVAQMGLSRTDLAVSFADDLALDLDVAAPKAPRRLLDQAVAAEAAQLMPYAAGEGLAFWSISRAAAGSEALARISFVPVHIVGPVLEALARSDVRPAIAMRSSASGTWAARPDWLAAATDRTPAFGRQFATMPRSARLAFAACTIVVGSLLANLAAGQWQISSLSAAAQQASDAARLAGKRETDVTFLAARQHDALTRVQVLDHLAARIPDGDWFERIDVKDDKVEFTGYAASAADTQRLIASLPGVRTAELMAAVTRDPGRNLERFRLLAQIGKGPREPAVARGTGGRP